MIRIFCQGVSSVLLGKTTSPKITLGLQFPPPVDHVLAELSSITHPSWGALSSKAHSDTELCRPRGHDKAVIHERGRDPKDQRTLQPCWSYSQKTAHNALSLGGAWPDTGKGKTQTVKLQLTSHINNNLRGLWLLKITYLDASLNVGNWIVADDSCKSTEYSRFEVTSKHKSRKGKLLSIWSIHWNIPFKSYDGKNNLTFLCIIQFWFFRWIISCICLLQENAYINICLIRVPLRLWGIILHLQRKAFEYLDIRPFLH